MKLLRSSASAACFTATALISKICHADAFGLSEGWYLSGGFGWDYANSIDLDSSDVSIDFDRGLTDGYVRRVRGFNRSRLHRNGVDRIFGVWLGVVCFGGIGCWRVL